MAGTNEPTRLSADEALAELMEGNRRFLRGESLSDDYCPVTHADLAKAQRPHAALLGCSDSRVPPELIFDTPMGDLFVIRVAGNVYSPEIAGTLQYAGSHLHIPLYVVLGHEGCGAIEAALASKHDGEQFHSDIHLLLESILPGLPDFDPTLSPEEEIARAVESNVRWTVRQILEAPDGLGQMLEGQARIIGAIYEIETGQVRILSP
jgi:carbonic anhydrase